MILAHPYQYRVHMFVYTVQNDYLVVRLSTLHDSISRGWGSWLRVVRFFLTNMYQESSTELHVIILGKVKHMAAWIKETFVLHLPAFVFSVPRPTVLAGG